MIAGIVSADENIRLHKEICDFYEFVRPREFERVVRTDVLARLQAVMRRWDPTCRVESFGSFAAGLYLPNADMDVVVNTESYLESGISDMNKKRFYKVAEFLVQQGFANPKSLLVIAKARVPLIKFVDGVTQLRIDMSFNNLSGITANDTFKLWKQLHPAMPIIATVIKQFLMMRGLNDVSVGGIGGFSVICLVTSLLQNMPRVQQGQLKPEDHLGEILLEFLDLYGNQFDYGRAAITMNPGGYMKKSFRMKRDRLSIIDPNRPENDIAGGSRLAPEIFKRFAEARAEILVAMKSPNSRSLLDRMLGGNYDVFLWHRTELKRLYVAKYGELPFEEV
jgi:non-canonical poly(A) RNA polymerase PAPD5/7